MQITMHNSICQTSQKELIEKKIHKVYKAKVIKRKKLKVLALNDYTAPTNYVSSLNSPISQNGTTYSHCSESFPIDNTEYRSNINAFFMKTIKFPKIKKDKKNNEPLNFEYYSKLPLKTKTKIKERKKISKEKDQVCLTEPHLKAFQKLIDDVNKLIEDSLIKKEIESIRFTIPLLQTKPSCTERISCKLKNIKTLKEKKHFDSLDNNEKYNTINSRITIPFILTDDKILSEIYCKNINYQKKALTNLYKE